MTISVTKFDREKALAEHLLGRLGLNGTAFEDPNAAGPETGIDVLAHLSDRRVVGIQLTEIDPYTAPGITRAAEKSLSRAAPNKPYGMWGQNDASIVLATLARSVERKARIAERHSFRGVDEVWLLICAGVPEFGAVVSTFVMTPSLSAEDINRATDNLLQGSKYKRCFFLPILGAEQALYKWETPDGWSKLVQLEDVRSVSRAAYIQDLLNAASRQELRRLVEEECRLILREMRQG